MPTVPRYLLAGAELPSAAAGDPGVTDAAPAARGSACSLFITHLQVVPM
jgi:hypothetical protein